jgi:hypothetical protein
VNEKWMNNSAKMSNGGVGMGLMGWRLAYSSWVLFINLFHQDGKAECVSFIQWYLLRSSYDTLLIQFLVVHYSAMSRFLISSYLYGICDCVSHGSCCSSMKGKLLEKASTDRANSCSLSWLLLLRPETHLSVTILDWLTGRVSGNHNQQPDSQKERSGSIGQVRLQRSKSNSKPHFFILGMLAWKGNHQG